MMKRMGKAGFMGLMVIFLSVLTIGGWAGNAAAVTFTIGTMTGTGTASPDGASWAFSGQFNFDNTNLGGGQTWKTILGDQGQYVFVANSLGNVLAYDYSAPYPTGLPNWPAPPAPSAYAAGGPNLKGGFGFDLNNTGNGGPHSSTFYGGVQNFTFSGGNSNTGTVTGALISDGNIHWYYGFDDFNVAGYPHGMTPLADWLLSDKFNIIGSYTLDPNFGSNGIFSLTATVTGSTVPLPPSMLLLGSGLLGLVGVGWRRSRKES